MTSSSFLPNKFPLLVLLLAFTASCQTPPLKKDESKKQTAMKENNPVVYFEIPVSNMDRAIQFYESVFEFSFEKDTIDGNDMALFPFDDSARGISGALARGEVYHPTVDGAILYFACADIDNTLKKAEQAGGNILYPKTDNGTLGFVAEIRDSEGNRIGLHQSKTVNE